MKIAIAITTLMALVYALLLTLNGAPHEISMVVMAESWADVLLPEELQLSYWWNLLVFPLVAMTIVFVGNQEAIAGKEPRPRRRLEYKKDGDNLVPISASFQEGSEEKEMVGRKYEARVHIFILNCVALIAAFGTTSVWAITSVIFPEYSQAGPLTFLASALAVWLAVYCGFGVLIEMAYVLFPGIFDGNLTDNDGDLTGNYQKRVIALTKQGFARSLPLVLGATIGYMLRMIIEAMVLPIRWTISQFRRVKISISNSKQA